MNELFGSHVGVKQCLLILKHVI